MAIAEKLQNIINEKTAQATMTNYGLTSENQIASSTKFIDYPKYIFEAFLEALRNPKTLFNNLPKVTGNGTNITLNNTAEAGMIIELEPSDISQDGIPTPSSPQEIHTISGDNTIKVVGKNLASNKINEYNTGSFVTYRLYPLNLEQGATYTLSATRIGELKANYYNYGIVKDGDTFSTFVGTRFIVDYATGVAYSPTTFTVDSSYVNPKLICYAPTETEFNELFANYNIQFEKNSEATTYEPYQEQLAQVNLGDLEYSKLGNYADVFMKPSGSNLFSKDYILAPIDTTQISANLQKGTYTLSLNGKPNFGNVIYIQLYKNGTLISQDGHITNTSSAVSYSTQSNWYYFQNVPNANYLTFTLDDDYDIKVAMYNADGTKRVMLNKGSVALDYEPYNNNKWYLKKNIGKVVLDGSETINTYTYNNMNGVNFSNVLLVAGTRMTGICNYSSKVGSYFSSNSIWLGVGDKYIYWLGILDELGLSQVIDFQTWLSTHNVILYYALATPTYTPITGTLATQLEDIYQYCKSYKGTTNISQINNDLPFELDVSALKDISNL